MPTPVKTSAAPKLQVMEDVPWVDCSIAARGLSAVSGVPRARRGIPGRFRERPVGRLPRSLRAEAEGVVAPDLDLPTGLGQIPGSAELRECVEIIAPEFGWDQNRIEKEIQSAGTVFQTLN